MLQRALSIPTESIAKPASHFLIGFVIVSVKNKIEEAVCAGSGTLVTIGSLHGVLTAAHVLEALPKHGQVGLVVETNSPEKLQKQVINMQHTDSVVISGKQFNQYGPDLAFLRLPQECVGWLKAQQSFYDLVKHRIDVLSNKEPSGSHCDVMAGMIHELTEDIPSEKRGVRRQLFKVLFFGVKLTALRFLDTHELFYFEPTSTPDLPLPKSFEGASGGSVWRFYLELYTVAKKS